MEYSLGDIIAMLTKRLVLIIVFTFLGLSVFYFIASHVTKPIYTASVQMYVNPNQYESSADLTKLTYAQQVTETYVYLLKTKAFYKSVSSEGDLTYNADQLQAMTNIEIVNNTELFRISVTSLSPDDSYNIAKAIEEVAPSWIKSIMSSAKISVVDPASRPLGPSGPDITRNTMVGGFLGFMLSIVLCFLLEILNTSVKNSEDLLKKYQIPVIGAIPSYSSSFTNKFRLLKLISGPNTQNNSGVVDDEKKFEVSEAYNELRTNLRFTILKSGCKKIIISSPLPEDGKSTTSTNIAITIAQMGAKVLLLDCDLRKGKIHSFFKIKSKPGISDVLSGMMNEFETVRQTKYENLHVIPMGSIPPNPSELLGSKQMEEVISRLEKNYDYIIIDSPPVNVVSDALSLAKVVDGVVIVVREKVTSHPNINKAMTKYNLAEANILGFVINGVSTERGKKSRSSYYYYKNNNG